MMLPLISQQTFRGTLRPPRKGSPDAAHNIVTLRMESGDDTVASEYFEDAILMMAGREPYALIEAAVTAAAQRSGGARPLREKRLPPNINVFGWCSWDR
jgi:raffinose synthase